MHLLDEIFLLLGMASVLELELLDLALEFDALLHQVVVVLLCLLLLASDLLDLFVRVD